MNFLGHLYLSGSDTKKMLYNLYGDFVKGSDLSRFPEEVQAGIRLHRKIDDYIDHHPHVLELVHRLQPDLPKVAAIAVDLYFDHLLAKHWDQYHSEELVDYLNQFYQSVDTSPGWFTSEFKTFVERLIRYNWISYYPLEEGLHKACNGVASRLSFETELRHGLHIYQKHQNDIKQVFESYMTDARAHFGIANSK